MENDRPTGRREFLKTVSAVAASAISGYLGRDIQLSHSKLKEIKALEKEFGIDAPLENTKVLTAFQFLSVYLDTHNKSQVRRYGKEPDEHARVFMNYIDTYLNKAKESQILEGVSEKVLEQEYFNLKDINDLWGFLSQALFPHDEINPNFIPQPIPIEPIYTAPERRIMV